MRENENKTVCFEQDNSKKCNRYKVNTSSIHSKILQQIFSCVYIKTAFVHGKRDLGGKQVYSVVIHNLLLLSNMSVSVEP